MLEMEKKEVDPLGEELERFHIDMTDDGNGTLKMRIALKFADEATSRKIMSEFRKRILKKKFYLLEPLFQKQPTLFLILKRILYPNRKLVVPKKLNHDCSLSISAVVK